MDECFHILSALIYLIASYPYLSSLTIQFGKYRGPHRAPVQLSPGVNFGVAGRTTHAYSGTHMCSVNRGLPIGVWALASESLGLFILP